MLIKHIEFAEKLWLWGLLVIPVTILLVKFVFKNANSKQTLADFADPKLLPHLIQKGEHATKANKLLALWSLLWLLTIIALANPRWNYIEYESYKPSSALVILLDLAGTMQAEDIKPKRIIRAKQQIQEILAAGKGLRIGLIGYAAHPHLVAPITDDLATVNYLLPALDSDLINKPGKDLKSALVAANKLLQVEPGNNKHILLITDGDQQSSCNDICKKLQKDGIIIHVAAVGSETGAPYKDNSGSLVRQNGQILVSKLNTKLLINISKAGLGRYWQINYLAPSAKEFVESILTLGGKHSVANTKVRQWDEGFIWLLIPLLLATVLFNRKLKLALCLTFVVTFGNSQPSYALDLFLNNERQAELLYNNGDYLNAANKFNDPYHKGVAFYKAKQYQQAEIQFKKSTRIAVKEHAKYNLANALLQQKQYQAAIECYEEVLAENSQHKMAADNLAIAKRLLEQQKNEDTNKPDCNCKDKSEAANKQQDENNNVNNKQAKDQQTKNDNNKSAQSNTAENNSTAKKDEKQKSDLKQQQQIADQKDSAKTAKETNAKNQESEHSDNKKGPSESKEPNLITDPTSVKGTKQENVDPETELWLQRMNSDVKIFLKNKFKIEEQRAS